LIHEPDKVDMEDTIMLTEFGQYLRKLRIDCKELLRDMAVKLEVTSSFLSAVETGKRNIPENWVKKIIQFYSLDFFEQEALKKAADNSAKTVTMDLSKMVPKKKETVLLFARTFDDVDDSAIDEIRRLLNKK